MTRSLLMCLNAKANKTEIYCAKGHKLGRQGTINIKALHRREPLYCKMCQDCEDFEYMGEQVPPEERGWL